MTVILKALTLFLFTLTPILIEATEYWWVAAVTAQRTQDGPQGPIRILRGSDLSQKQRSIVKKRTPALMETITFAASVAIKECQRQFKDRKWNCSVTSPYNVFGPVLQRACRETAFAYAIAAAAVSHSISQSCVKGSLKSCTCDNPSKQINVGWQWGGCGDNVRFGDNFARKFVNAAEIDSDFRARVNMHNNEAGRRAVKDNISRVCTCHGPSQVCTQKTCWNAAPKFEKVGDMLKGKFDGASRVELEQNSPGRKITFTPVNKEHKKPTKADLVYYEDSPDFCTKNSKVGSLGTAGRECNSTSLDVDGCDLLCCSRGYRSDYKTVETLCKCKFQWCCSYVCQPCKETKNVHLCL